MSFSALYDVFFFAGLVLLSVGAGLVFLPAGLIVAGLVLLAVTVLGVRNGGQRAR